MRARPAPSFTASVRQDLCRTIRNGHASLPLARKAARKKDSQYQRAFACRARKSTQDKA